MRVFAIYKLTYNQFIFVFFFKANHLWSPLSYSHRFMPASEKQPRQILHSCKNTGNSTRAGYFPKSP